MIRVAINGACGRMGRRLVAMVSEEDDMGVVAALEQSGHPSLGSDAGEVAGCGKIGVPVTDALGVAADVAIDFSSPSSTAALATVCAEKGVALVTGTTGLSPAQKTSLATAGQKTPVLLAPNMSVGMNLLFKLAADAASALGDDYDVEIIEKHHRFKKDAPSGTALRLAEAVAQATGRHLEGCVNYGRQGQSPGRPAEEIGIHSVRAGDIVGDHTVLFSSLGERIELTHRAHTRDTFVRGAIRAARFLAGRAPGLYEMTDVLST
ncbi:MAG: 4-hydroxy-tetrahydrodipicolinate reductase [Alphaproteobacteria bacterium]